MQARLTTLCDNSSAMTLGVAAEHGLSFFVEAKDKALIFDTGQTTIAAKNAMTLGINLKGCPIALSHGHYDHTGGLQDILGLTGPTRVFAHPEIFVTRFHLHNGRLRPIGIPWSRKELEVMGAGFDLSPKPREILEGIWLTGEIPRRASFERPHADLVVSSAPPHDGPLLPEETLSLDPLLDDQALLVETQKGVIIVLGCAHSGMINTIEHARNITGLEPFGVVGGTHLGFLEPDQLKETLEALQSYELGLIGTCHCTGPRASASLFCRFGEKVVFCSAGSTLMV